MEIFFLYSIFHLSSRMVTVLAWTVKGPGLNLGLVSSKNITGLISWVVLARYSLFVLKVLLNTNQAKLSTSCFPHTHSLVISYCSLCCITIMILASCELCWRWWIKVMQLL